MDFNATFTADINFDWGLRYLSYHIFRLWTNSDSGGNIKWYWVLRYVTKLLSTQGRPYCIMGIPSDWKGGTAGKYGQVAVYTLLIVFSLPVGRDLLGAVSVTYTRTSLASNRTSGTDCRGMNLYQAIVSPALYAILLA